MTTLSTFDFNTNTIRVVDIDGEPWFSVTDVLFALDYPQSSHTNIRKKLSGDELQLNSFKTRVGVRTSYIVSESGLYKLIMRSDKPEARPFQDWVTKVVLPSIRKNDGYISGQEQLSNGDTAALFGMMKEMMTQMEKLTSEVRSPSCKPARTPAQPRGSKQAINQLAFTILQERLRDLSAKEIGFLGAMTESSGRISTLQRGYLADLGKRHLGRSFGL